MSSRALRNGLVAALVAALGLVSSPPASAAPAGGLDDPACVPVPEHPNPVVLLHGLGAPPGGSFSYLGPELASAGYCAFTIHYGTTAPFWYPGGFAAMDASAQQIRDFITQVRTTTGAAEVDLVGHSEGGLHALYVPKRFGLGDEVGRVVSLAPPTHGTDGSGFLTVARALGLPPLVRPLADLFGCTACDEIAISEAFIERLNDGPITVPSITYTVIASRYDYIVTPTATSFVQEPGVTNLTVQDVCPTDPVGHVGLVFDPGVRDLVTNALDPAHAAPVRCSYGPPF